MDVFDLAASLTLNTNNYMNGLSAAGSAISSFGSKLSSGLQTAAKVSASAVGAAATGIASLTTAAVNNYAEYEQLVGGVDTLFKDASKKVQEYANNAYKTAGMSANDYMENATAFSASLISSLGGDTAAAAEYANRAMVSMSDNANKMGTNIDSIVQTYQSLSRGNYAMLDNLKLGYGGTKAELQRLIADAATYTDVQKEMGITVDASSMSFDNIVNAIAVVQGHLGIAGATALEAGTTIEGSVNSMKAAWANLVTGIADDNANMEELISKFITTIVGDGTESNLGVLGNIMPTIKHALNGAANLINEMVPIIMQEVPAIINENLPILVEAAVGIVQSLVDGISSNQEMLFNTIFDVVTYLAESFISLLPKIVELGLNLIVSLANGIAENLPQLIPTVMNVITQIVETLTNPDTLGNLVNASVSIIVTLADGIMNALPTLLEKAPIIMQNLVNTLIENAPKLIESASTIIETLSSGIAGFIPNLIPTIVSIVITIVENLINNVDKLIDSAISIIMALANGLINSLPILIEKAPVIIQNLVDAIVNNAPKLLDAAFTLITTLAKALIDYLPDLLASIPKIISSLVDGLIEVAPKLLSSALEFIKTLAKGLIEYLPTFVAKAPAIIAKLSTSLIENVGKLSLAAVKIIASLAKGLIDNLPNLLSKIPRLVSDIMNGFKNEIGDWPKDIGSMIVNGLWDGLRNGWNWLTDSVRNLANDLLNAAKDTLGIHSPSREFAKIGKFCVAGFNEGIDDLMDTSTITKSISASVDDISANVTSVNAGANRNGNGVQYNQTINVNQKISTPDELARAIKLESRYGLMRGVSLG